MKNIFIVIGVLSITVSLKAQVWLDLGYRISVDNEAGSKEGAYFRGIDAHLSWCDCSKITLGVQTRKVVNRFSLDGPSYFPQIDFSDFHFPNDQLTGYYVKRDLRIPLNYYRRISLIKNLYFQANVGAFTNLSYDKHSSRFLFDKNDEQTKEVTFLHERNATNQSFFIMDQLGLMGGVSLEYHLKPIGAFFIGVNFQKNMRKSYTDKYSMSMQQISYDANGNEIENFTRYNEFSDKRKVPTVFVEFGFKTCGFNLTGKRKKKPTNTNGAWPF